MHKNTIPPIVITAAATATTFYGLYALARIGCGISSFIFIAAISFTVILFLSAPFFIGNFTFSSIKAVHFWDDPSVKNAMYEYSIKSGTFNTNTNFENAEITETGNTATEDFSGLTEIPDFIPAVNFETYTVAKEIGRASCRERV